MQTVHDPTAKAKKNKKKQSNLHDRFRAVACNGGQSGGRLMNLRTWIAKGLGLTIIPDICGKKRLGKQRRIITRGLFYSKKEFNLREIIVKNIYIYSRGIK